MTQDEQLIADRVELSYGSELVLRGASLTIAPAERVAIVGPSGAGKSTLMYCLAGVTVPASGTIRFGNHVVSELGPEDRAELRLRRFGFVFQFGELVPELSLIDNVALPLWLAGARRRQARIEAGRLLNRLGLAEVTQRRPPAQVSGGEMQRAAVARALIHRPSVVFADEPTGALDSRTAERVMGLLLQEVAAAGAALVMVTHDDKIAAQLDRRVMLVDGRVVLS